MKTLGKLGSVSPVAVDKALISAGNKVLTLRLDTSFSDSNVDFGTSDMPYDLVSEPKDCMEDHDKDWLPGDD